MRVSQSHPTHHFAGEQNQLRSLAPAWLLDFLTRARRSTVCQKDVYRVESDGEEVVEQDEGFRRESKQFRNQRWLVLFFSQRRYDLP